MESAELVALIPVDRAVALNKHPVWQMPARELYRRLIEKTNGRVLRSDIGWAAADEADFVDLFPDGGRWAEWEAAQQAVEVVIGERVIELG
jgi:hypothetical protein